MVQLAFRPMIKDRVPRLVRPSLHFDFGAAVVRHDVNHRPRGAPPHELVELDEDRLALHPHIEHLEVREGCETAYMAIVEQLRNPRLRLGEPPKRLKLRGVLDPDFGEPRFPVGVPVKEPRVVGEAPVDSGKGPGRRGTEHIEVPGPLKGPHDLSPDKGHTCASEGDGREDAESPGEEAGDANPDEVSLWVDPGPLLDVVKEPVGELTMVYLQLNASIKPHS